MTDEQTNKADTTRTQDDTANTDSEKPVSIVEEAAKIRDEIRAEREKLDEANKKKETLQANEMLSGTSGGAIEAPTISEEEQKTKDAAEFFKGTSLGDAISK